MVAGDRDRRRAVDLSDFRQVVAHRAQVASASERASSGEQFGGGVGDPLAWFRFGQRVACGRSSEALYEALGDGLRELTGASRVTLHWQGSVPGRVIVPLIGPPLLLPLALPARTGDLTVQGNLVCVQLHEDERGRMLLTLTVTPQRDLLRVLGEAAGELGQLVLRAHWYDLAGSLSFALAESQADADLGDVRQELLLKLAGAIHAAAEEAVGIVVDLTAGRVPRIVLYDGRYGQPRQLLADPYLRRKLSQSPDGQELPLEGKAAEHLARLLGEDPAGLILRLKSVQATGYFSGWLGVGLRSRGSLQPSAPEPASPPTPASLRLSGQMVAIILLRLLAPQAHHLLREAAFGEAAFRAGVYQRDTDIGMDLHDSVLQELSYLRLQAELAQSELSDTLPEVTRRLREVSASAHTLIDDLRQLAMFLTRDVALDMTSSLRQLVDRFGSRLDAEMEFEVIGQERELPPRLSGHLFRLLQEALNNVSKHAGAKHVKVEVVYRDQHRVLLRVTDDGQGFEPDAIPEPGLGLRGMARRVEQMGGVLRISSRPGQGTTVTADLPT